MDEKLRPSAILLCFQQYFVNFMCETMNLVVLCQQPSFQDLIMNYVAFAGILNIDNLFMETQDKFNPELK